MKYSLTLRNYDDRVLWYVFTNFEKVNTDGPVPVNRVKSILDKLTPNITKIELLQNVFGYKLSGNIEPEVFFDVWDILEK